MLKTPLQQAVYIYIYIESFFNLVMIVYIYIYIYIYKTPVQITHVIKSKTKTCYRREQRSWYCKMQQGFQIKTIRNSDVISFLEGHQQISKSALRLSLNVLGMQIGCCHILDIIIKQCE